MSLTQQKLKLYMKKTPCKDCPFRKDSLVGWLGEKRAKQIATDLYEKT